MEPTGPFEDDPNLTDKKFPGNPTRSYRTRDPLRVVGEVEDWVPHPPTSCRQCATTSRSSSGWASRRSTTEAADVEPDIGQVRNLLPGTSG